MTDKDKSSSNPAPAETTDARSPNDVGFKKPPKHSQFTKGKSGNPTGRPKGARNIQSIVMKEARKRIRVNVGGKIVLMTKAEAAVQQMFNAAASGNLRAVRDIHYWMETYREAAQSDDGAEWNEADLETQENTLKRVRRMMEQQTQVEEGGNEAHGEDNDIAELEGL